MAQQSFQPCGVQLTEAINNSDCDFACIIDPQSYSDFVEIFKEYKNFDQAFDKEISCFKSPKFSVPIVYSPLREPSDYQDVRVYQEAAAKAVNRAIKAGSKKPLLLVPGSNRFKTAEINTILGALQELYVPIQLREDVPSKKQRIEILKILIQRGNNKVPNKILKEALLLDSGRFVARDIGVGDPEYMTPLNVEKYLRSAFSSIKITVISDLTVLKKEYPLFEAVNRAARSVQRHQGRIIFLEYKPPHAVKKSLLLVGKGVTYDTGGADIKAGGVMAGMSRDKCGAAAVAGFMKIVEQEKPVDIHVIAALCMVRNSVGEECYVADEIITSRAGIRVRVGNTDAEGRMCMTDALCKMKELAVNLPDPHLFTIATLTGHAIVTVGEGYSIVIDNSVARKSNHAEMLKKIGDKIGDPFEISTLREEDFEFNAAKVIGEHVVQCNNLASSRTPRGHQIVEQEKPVDIHVIAALCMVRNSVGEECYVSDEIITSRAGIRVRVGNTDAEGRMCMTDALCKMKELAEDLPDPHIFTVATLTGHACLAVGEGYSIVIDNSVARKSTHAEMLKKIGDEIGDPFEISTLREDDFDFNAAKVIGEDVVQCNNLASSRTPRGHQVPVSFMIVASGLDKNGLMSEKQIKYSHLDIAASAGEYPKIPTGSPIVALAKTHLNI